MYWPRGARTMIGVYCECGVSVDRRSLMVCGASSGSVTMHNRVAYKDSRSRCYISETYVACEVSVRRRARVSS